MTKTWVQQPNNDNFNDALWHPEKGSLKRPIKRLRYSRTAPYSGPSGSIEDDFFCKSQKMLCYIYKYMLCGKYINSL